MSRHSLTGWLFAALLLAATAASAADRYVNDVIGSDSYDGLSATIGGGHGPYLTPHCSALGAGDAEHIPFTGLDYTTGIFCTDKAASSGNAMEPITFLGEPADGMLPRIRVSSGQAVQLRDNISYVQIKYLDTFVTTTTGAGFLIGSAGYEGTVHHVLLDHDHVSYAGGDCINMEFDDYNTVAYTDVEHCGQLDTSASDSGISLLAPVVSAAGDDGLLDGCYGLPSDMAATYGTGFRNCVVRTRCWGVLKGQVGSDGNCDVEDDANCSQFPLTNCHGVSYRFASLWAENTCLSVDGRCVHIFSTSTTVGITRVSHNTSYNACQGGAPCGSTNGDFDVLGKTGYPSAGNFEFDHNIVYTTGSHYSVDVSLAAGAKVSIFCNDLYGGSGAVHDDGSGTITQSADITVDPVLMHLSASPVDADLRPSSSSPNPNC